MKTVYFKKIHPDAIIPTYAKVGDAGADLTATSKTATEKYIEYGTGLSVYMPDGYCGFLFPRSSITKMGLSLKNSVGVLDSGYRGEIMLRFHNFGGGLPSYEIGNRIAQLVIMPTTQFGFVEVDELPESERGNGGFGSTG
jgi:dUTP pyrophosphatase